MTTPEQSASRRRVRTMLAVLAAFAAGCGSSSDNAPTGICKGAMSAQLLAPLTGPPASLDVRDGWLVATTADSGRQDGTVIAVNLATGAFQTIASGRASPRNVAVGPPDAYWMEYYPNSGADAGGAIVAAPLDGSAPPREVVQVAPGGFQMLFDGGTLYFQELNGGISSLATGATAATTVVPEVAALFLTSDRQNLYWTDCSLKSVDRAPKAGGDKQHLADGFCPYGIATDGVDLYYADLYTKLDDGSYVEGPQLHRLPAAGGTDTVVSDTAQPVSNLGMDARNLYFAGQDGGLYRLPRSGGGSQQLATGAARDVVIDSACVYWTDSSANAVFTLPK